MIHRELKKDTAVCSWDGEFHRAEILKMKGNFWKTMGYSVKSLCYLRPEEALMLYEKGTIVVKQGEAIIPLDIFYDKVMEVIGLSCYLVYCKLKMLEYTCFYHGESVRTFNFDLYASDPKTLPLESYVAYDVFYYHEKFSKKNLSTTSPTARVIVTEGEDSPPAELILRLLGEALKIPLIFAHVSTNSTVNLVEFGDAQAILNLENVEFPHILTDSKGITLVTVLENAREARAEKRRLAQELKEAKEKDAKNREERLKEERAKKGVSEIGKKERGKNKNEVATAAAGGYNVRDVDLGDAVADIKSFEMNTGDALDGVGLMFEGWKEIDRNDDGDSDVVMKINGQDNDCSYGDVDNDIDDDVNDATKKRRKVSFAPNEEDVRELDAIDGLLDLDTVGFEDEDISEADKTRNIDEFSKTDDDE